MSIVRDPEKIEENSDFIIFTLRYPQNAVKPNITLANFETDQGVQAYIKIAYSPSIFETVLPYPIDDLNTKLTTHREMNILTLEVKKLTVSDLTYQKPEKSILKNLAKKALASLTRAEQKRIKDCVDQKYVLKKQAVSTSMNLDKSLRQHQESSKLDEKIKAIKELGLDEDDEEALSIHKEADKAIDAAIAKHQRQLRFLKKVGNQKKMDTPLRRGEIKVELSERIFPTAARESLKAEETEWLQRQAEYRKRIEIDNPDLSEHEKDPIWLKNKGNSLFKQGNFDSAAHAYSMALKITPKDPNLFLNRAAAYHQLRKLHKSVSDCQAAIDLLQPAVEDNKNQRAKAFSRSNMVSKIN